MKLLRPLLNLVILTVYLVRVTLFMVTRICGSIPGGGAIMFLTIAYLIVNPKSPALFYIPFVFVVACYHSYPHLRVGSRPRFLQAPAPPPPPAPIASTAKGHADDPNEATVIGRLDPKLRDLLRQKTDGAAH